mmetsp:Transcript_149433/g.264191  ORF Transcript_149433/g.264191 Transcript_149433/m.264191 type:complete len:80 (-) Transcript_149433:1088-1327(-)
MSNEGAEYGGGGGNRVSGFGRSSCIKTLYKDTSSSSFDDCMKEMFDEKGEVAGTCSPPERTRESRLMGCCTDLQHDAEY